MLYEDINEMCLPVHTVTIVTFWTEQRVWTEGLYLVFLVDGNILNQDLCGVNTFMKIILLLMME